MSLAHFISYVPILYYFDVQKLSNQKGQIIKGKCGWACNVIALSKKKTCWKQNFKRFSMVALQQADSQKNKS
jgi:hypothetical protein